MELFVKNRKNGKYSKMGQILIISQRNGIKFETLATLLRRCR